MCFVLKERLDNLNLAYTICEDKETMIKMGFSSVPMLEVDGNIMNYKDAIKWIKEREK